MQNQSTNDNVWICTDPDCCQYQKKTGYGQYHMVQAIGPFPNGRWQVVSSAINLGDYTKDEIDRIVRMYYPSMDALVEIYAEFSNGVIAECLFEQMISPGAKFGSMDEAADHIRSSFIGDPEDSNFYIPF